MSDEMEIGNTGLVAMPDGWFKNIKNNTTINPSGVVFNENGDVLFDPTKDIDLNKKG